MRQLKINSDALIVSLRNYPPFDQALERETLLRVAMRLSTAALIDAAEFLRQCAEARKPVEPHHGH